MSNILGCAVGTLFARVIIRGDVATVNYNVSESAMCTCQLDSETPVSCKIIIGIQPIEDYILFLLSGDPGHMFTDLMPGNHSVNVVCFGTVTNQTFSVMLPFSVSGKGFGQINGAS